MTDEIDELHDRIEQLEKRVAELEDSGDSRGKSGAQNDLLDRYDEYVVDHSEAVETAHPRQLMKLYGEAGVVDKKKQKRRTKRLKKVVGKDE